MNGAEALLRTLLNHDVRVCFANPGTSEMHLVAALDSFPSMRAVLCLFEGVATGAADGYGRMTGGTPAATLLHLGPGLANGMANLHNARRAGTPLLNIVGDHAASHQPLDSPLQSDIGSAAATVSTWVKRPSRSQDLGPAAAEAVAAAITAGGVATLIVPADVSWSEGAEPAKPAAKNPETAKSGTAAPGAASFGTASPEVASSEAASSSGTAELGTAKTGTAEPGSALSAVRQALTGGEPVALLLDGPALSDEGLAAADRIAQVTGARVFCLTWPARLRRGAGVPAVTPLSYRAETVHEQLRDVKHLVLVGGARPPVTSFAYPGQEGRLTPPGAAVLTVDTLGPLADELAPGVPERRVLPSEIPVATGILDSDNWAYALAAGLPDNCVVVDEAITSGLTVLPDAFGRAPAHDVLGLTGLAIGQGLPLAAGAAIACPDRPVVCLEADGSAMYTVSALWTHAREKLDITTVVLNNRSYAILRAELARVGASASGPSTAAMIDLVGPELDFVSLSEGMGVPATRAHTIEELASQFKAAVTAPGPHLIEAVLTPKR